MSKSALYAGIGQGLMSFGQSFGRALEAETLEELRAKNVRENWARQDQIRSEQNDRQDTIRNEQQVIVEARNAVTDSRYTLDQEQKSKADNDTAEFRKTQIENNQTNAVKTQEYRDKDLAAKERRALEKDSRDDIKNDNTRFHDRTKPFTKGINKAQSEIQELLLPSVDSIVGKLSGAELDAAIAPYQDRINTLQAQRDSFIISFYGNDKNMVHPESEGARAYAELLAEFEPRTLGGPSESPTVETRTKPSVADALSAHKLKQSTASVIDPVIADNTTIEPQDTSLMGTPNGGARQLMGGDRERGLRQKRVDDMAASDARDAAETARRTEAAGYVVDFTKGRSLTVPQLEIALARAESRGFTKEIAGIKAELASMSGQDPAPVATLETVLPVGGASDAARNAGPRTPAPEQIEQEGILSQTSRILNDAQDRKSEEIKARRAANDIELANERRINASVQTVLPVTDEPTPTASELDESQATELEFKVMSMKKKGNTKAQVLDSLGRKDRFGDPIRIHPALMAAINLVYG